MIPHESVENIFFPRAEDDSRSICVRACLDVFLIPRPVVSRVLLHFKVQGLVPPSQGKNEYQSYYTCHSCDYFKTKTPKTRQATPMAMECCGDGFLEFCNGRRVKVRCVFCVRCFCLKSVEDMKKNMSVCLS